jgi:hypothetical protein
MDTRPFKRLAKEHAAAVQAYMDAGRHVGETLGMLAAEIDNQAEAKGSAYRVFPRADAAAGLIDESFRAVRSALEPE